MSGFAEAFGLFRYDETPRPISDLAYGVSESSLHFETPPSETNESWTLCDDAGMQELGGFVPSLGSVCFCRKNGM